MYILWGVHLLSHNFVSRNIGREEICSVDLWRVCRCGPVLLSQERLIIVKPYFLTAVHWYVEKERSGCNSQWIPFLSTKVTPPGCTNCLSQRSPLELNGPRSVKLPFLLGFGLQGMAIWRGLPYCWIYMFWLNRKFKILGLLVWHLSQVPAMFL